MKNKIVEVPGIKEPITRSPGFGKKLLADFKLDLLALCGFGCRYCSSNWGNYLRINRERFARYTEQQLGGLTFPDEDPSLTFVWPDVLDRLRAQLERRPRTWGQGQTLVFSMLTDGFSPWLVKRGITTEALRLVLDHTAFRIRVLTKNAVVGTPHWIDFFSRYPGRFVVGLSTGTMDDEWARPMEVGTSAPSARLRALRALQEAGLPTYAMLCPIFPNVLGSGQLELLLDQVRPELVEHVWAEPFNDRVNWRVVRDSYAPGTTGYEWFTKVYEHKNHRLWSRYATDLYVRLRAHAERAHWGPKLRFLLYEDLITDEDAPRFLGFNGVLLQSKPGADGRSQNAALAAIQGTRSGDAPAGAKEH